jgi:hypothetical protein
LGILKISPARFNWIRDVRVGRVLSCLGKGFRVRTQSFLSKQVAQAKSSLLRHKFLSYKKLRFFCPLLFGQSLSLLKICSQNYLRTFQRNCRFSNYVNSGHFLHLTMWKMLHIKNLICYQWELSIFSLGSCTLCRKKTLSKKLFFFFILLKKSLQK